MSSTGRRVSVSDEGSKTSEKYYLALRGAGGGEEVGGMGDEQAMTSRAAIQPMLAPNRSVRKDNPNEKIQVNAKRKKPEKPEKEYQSACKGG